MLHNFDLPTIYPNSLLPGSDGYFYGTTKEGALEGYEEQDGAVFKMDSGGAVTVLQPFDGTTGAYPRGQLIESGGYFYGATLRGGTNSCGTHTCGAVYKMDSTGALIMLHSFNDNDGAEP